jgi:hypothetical protein
MGSSREEQYRLTEDQLRSRKGKDAEEAIKCVNEIRESGHKAEIYYSERDGYSVLQSDTVDPERRKVLESYRAGAKRRKY